MNITISRADTIYSVIKKEKEKYTSQSPSATVQNINIRLSLKDMCGISDIISIIIRTECFNFRGVTRHYTSYSSRDICYRDLSILSMFNSLVLHLGLAYFTPQTAQLTRGFQPTYNTYNMNKTSCRKFHLNFSLYFKTIRQALSLLLVLFLFFLHANTIPEIRIYLNNVGFPQGTVFAPTLFTIYTSNKLEPSDTNQFFIQTHYQGLNLKVD